MNQEWRRYVYCLEILQKRIDNVFVYKLMDYDINEVEHLQKSWEEFKTDLQGRQLVLVTPNPRSKEFICYFKEDFPIAGILSAKKSEFGSIFEGYKIQSVFTDLYNFAKENTVFLLCSVNWNDYINRLQGLGYDKVYSLRLLCRSEQNRESKYTEKFHTVLGVMGAAVCSEEWQKKRVNELMMYLEDVDSRIALKEILTYREKRSDRYSFIAEEITKGDPHYFDRKFLTFGTDEVYMDIGPADGGTITDFINRVHNRFSRIYAWEIGQKSLEILQKKFTDNRIEILPYGAWNEETLMAVSGSAGNRSVSINGKTAIQCKRIDDVIEGAVTFIKMDIEGAELKALEGARNIIQKYKPKLAISLYHRQNDIFEIPLWIHDLVPEYKLYIRHHRDTPNDTVLYAIL